MTDLGAVFTWDSDIQADSSFVTFEEGDYLFKVVEFERDQYNGSAKLPACPQANMKLEIYADGGATTTVVDKLKLCQKMEFSLSAFFRATGQKKHGEKLRMDFPGAIGCYGIVHIVKTEGNTSGTFFNNVGNNGYKDHDPEMIARYKEAAGIHDGDGQQVSMQWQ